MSSFFRLLVRGRFVRMSVKNVFDDVVARGWPAVEAWVADQEPESLFLDFKQKSHGDDKFSDKDRAHLARAISSFTNTSGGMLVFGISTKKNNSSNSSFDRARAIVHVKNLDRFYNSIDRNIHTVTDPPIAGIRVEAIKDPTCADTGVVVVYIPESQGGPHRVTNGDAESNDRYYARTSTSTFAMPHSLLADRFGRRPHPQLGLKFRYLGLHGADANSAVLDFWITNRGRGLAEGAAIDFSLSGGSLLRDGSFSFREISIHSRVQTYNMPDGSAATMLRLIDGIVYPNQERYLGKAICWDVKSTDGFAWIRGIIYAGNVQPTTFEYQFDLTNRPSEPFVAQML